MAIHKKLYKTHTTTMPSQSEIAMKSSLIIVLFIFHFVDSRSLEIVKHGLKDMNGNEVSDGNSNREERRLVGQQTEYGSDSTSQSYPISTVCIQRSPLNTELSCPEYKGGLRIKWVCE